MTAPTRRYLSLAGVQSSCCLLLAVHGRIPSFDAAIFADPGWEPAAVYVQLRRLERLAASAGIPIVRVTAGNIRRDAIDPAHRFASMPMFTLGPNGERGMARRQCTAEYKIRPIKIEVRRRLGYPHPARVPADVYAEMAIGVSVDEIHRARDADVAYMRNTFPLLDLGWRRGDCSAYLAEHGLADTPPQRVHRLPVSHRRGMGPAARAGLGRVGRRGRVRPRDPPRLGTGQHGRSPAARAVLPAPPAGAPRPSGAAATTRR